MASADAVSIVRELGIRESGQSGPLALLGPGGHAAPILPVARKLGITKRIGWHTFRHTYSTLLRSTGAELKIMQELLRHSTIRVTLDTYTQAVTTEKRNAQEAVVALLFRGKTKET
jgi:integrase